MATPCFYILNGRSGGIIGSFTVTREEEKDEREACLGFTHRIQFEKKLRLQKSIPFNQFCQKAFPDYLDNYGNVNGQVIRGKSVIKIEEEAAEYLTKKVEKVSDFTI